MTFFDYLKSFFLLLIILQISPTILTSIKKQYLNYIEPHAQVGIITIDGMVTDAEQHIKNLRTFFKDTDIKAILLKIDCHGCATGSGESIFHEINALKNEYRKPIIALVENICTSGGYHIACASDHIIAPGMSLIGSIGVTFPYLFQFDELIKHHNIGYTPMTAGKYKSATNPLVPISDEDKQELQKVLDDTYDQFINHVAISRKLSLADASSWADAKLFSGRQALQLGLIDEIGSMTNAIKIIKNKALIEGEIVWIHPQKIVRFWDMIIGQESAINTREIFSGFWQSLFTHAHCSLQKTYTQ